jgi:hypothetical protein
VQEETNRNVYSVLCVGEGDVRTERRGEGWGPGRVGRLPAPRDRARRKRRHLRIPLEAIHTELYTCAAARRAARAGQRPGR